MKKIKQEKNYENNDNFKQFQTVRLVTNDYLNLGVSKNSLGVILEVYENDYYEVEFCNEKGETLLLQSFNKKELEIV